MKFSQGANAIVKQVYDGVDIDDVIRGVTHTSDGEILGPCLLETHIRRPPLPRPMIFGSTSTCDLYIGGVGIDTEKKATVAGIVGKLENPFPLTAADVQDAFTLKIIGKVHRAAARIISVIRKKPIMRLQSRKRFFVHKHRPKPNFHTEANDIACIAATSISHAKLKSKDSRNGEITPDENDEKALQ